MTYAIAFAFLAVLSAMQAYVAEVWWQSAALAWAALSCAAVSLAYACAAPWVFGKRGDGTIPWWRQVPLLPYHLLARTVSWCLARFGGEPPWQRVDDRLVVARRLRAHEVPADVATVLDLTCELPEIAALRGPGYRCLPLLDARAGTPQALVAAVRALAPVPGTLLIHCAQGHGRTGLVAALVLIARNPDLGTTDAVARLRAIRPGIGLSRIQSAALEQAAALLRAADG